MSLLPLVSLLTVMSTPPDSIYALAVDSAKYPQESIVWLLDFGDVKREADGTGTMTTRSVIQILTENAARGFREQSFSYSPGHERLTINWIRVVKPNGEVISEAPTHVQDADIPAVMGDPVYSDRKVKRVSLTGVAPGTIIDYSYTREELKPFLTGDFWSSWRVTTGTPVMRSYFRANVPESLKLHIREHGLTFKRAEKVENGRRIITWATSNVAPLKAEPFTPDSLQRGMSFNLSGALEWKDIARWYADNARDRYEPSPALKTKVSELVKGAKTMDDSIARVHRWVVQDIRYVAIALGLGGYQPRLPDSVMKTGFGDCKDKATLFIAAMKLFGVPAYPVILNSYVWVNESVPSISQFNHVIVAYDRGPHRQYVDMTAELIRIGFLPISYQGSFGLIVHEDGSSEAIRFPAFQHAENQLVMRLMGTLKEDGTFAGWFEQAGTGMGEELLRSLAKSLTDSTRRDNFRNATARRYAREGESDSLEYFQGTDFAAKPVIRVRISKGRLADPSGSMMILPLPMGDGSVYATTASNIEKEPKRVGPIDVKKLLPPVGTLQEITMTLPAGWRAKLPASVSVKGILGTYSSSYSQTGNILRIQRTVMGTMGVLPSETTADVLAWLREAAKDDARFIVLERGT